MHELKHHGIRTAGFTLVEVAVVLLIVVALLGGLIMPLAAQIEQTRASEAQKGLADIREALLGFAVINGRLPCPGTVTDPASTSYGVEDCAAGPTVEGFLPWKTLGLTELDPWGVRRTASGDPTGGVWRYRVDRNFRGASPFALTTSFGDQLEVRDHSGNRLTTTTERPVAIVFTTGPDRTPNGRNRNDGTDPNFFSYGAGERTQTFDDLLVWIGRPLLFSRMVVAGKLP